MLQASGVIRDFRIARDFGEGQGFAVTGWIIAFRPSDEQTLRYHPQGRVADDPVADRTAERYQFIPNLSLADQEIARRFLRKRSGSPSGRRASNTTCTPDGNGAGKQPALLERQHHDTASAVRGVHGDLKQTPALQWFESGGQCRCDPFQAAMLLLPCLVLLAGSGTSLTRIARWLARSGAAHHRSVVPAPWRHAAPGGTDRHPGPQGCLKRGVRRH